MSNIFVALLAVVMSLAIGILAPTASRSADCTFLSDGDWGPVATFTGTTDCGVLTGADTFVVPSGVEVKIIGDIIMDGVAGEWIRVEAGGLLSASALDRSGGDARLEIALNKLGLLCETGSTCSFQGGFRRSDGGTQELVDVLDNTTHFDTGEIIPCPGWNDGSGAWETDCSGDLTGLNDVVGSPYEVGILYPNLATTDPTLNASIAEFELQDVLCFYDGDRSDPLAPVDDGFCYEIVWATASGSIPGDDGAMIMIDIRQTNPDQPRDTGYPFSLREIRTDVNLGTTSVGDRTITTQGNLVQGVRARERAGMWLRFSDSSGNPLNESYKISRTWNEPANGDASADCPIGSPACDVIEIYDPRGFQSELAPGDRVWIDYGHSFGDDFFVFAPLVLTEADGIQEPTKFKTITIRGSTHVVGVLIDDISGIRFEDATGSTVEAVWLRDVTGGGTVAPGNGGALTITNASDTTFSRISSTGGNGTGANDQIHTIVLGAASTVMSGLTLADIAIRHHGDDCISNPGEVDLLLDRVRCEWSTPDAESCDMIGINNPARPITGEARDILCQDCTRSGSIIVGYSSTDFEIDGVVRWGVDEVFHGNGAPGIFVRNLLSIGGDRRLPANVENFVVALHTDLGGQPGTGGLIHPSSVTIQDGIIRDFAWHNTRIGDTMSEGSVNNVLVLDVGTTQDCSTIECRAFNVLPPTGSLDIDRVTIAVSPEGSTDFDSGIQSNTTLDIGVNGLLVSGFNRSSGLGYGVGGSPNGTAKMFATTTTGPCLWDNKVDSPNPAELPLSTVVGTDPQLFDPDNRRFDPIAGGVADTNACGIKRGVNAPGFGKFRWINAITRTVPEVQADDPDGDGVVNDVYASVCEDEEDEDCADNCPVLFNPSQVNTDSDGAGNDCDIDDDGDGLDDASETNTGIFIDASDTGTNPLLADTDGDGFDDGIEVAESTDPNDPLSVPGPTPSVPSTSILARLIVMSLVASLAQWGMRRPSRIFARDVVSGVKSR